MEINDKVKVKDDAQSYFAGQVGTVTAFEDNMIYLTFPLKLSGSISVSYFEDELEDVGAANK